MQDAHLADDLNKDNHGIYLLSEVRDETCCWICLFLYGMRNDSCTISSESVLGDTGHFAASFGGIQFVLLLNCVEKCKYKVYNGHAEHTAPYDGGLVWLKNNFVK